MAIHRSNMDAATPGKYKCCCIFHFTFLGLMLSAACLLAILGVEVVRPRVYVSDFLHTNCTVLSKKHQVGEMQECDCGKNCQGDFPCDQIWVKISANTTRTDGRFLLRYDEKVLISLPECSFMADPCNNDYIRNNKTIFEQMSKFTIGNTYQCLYNPEDYSEVIAMRNTEIFHWLFWPALVVVIFCIGALSTCFHCLMGCRISRDIKKARSMGKAQQIAEIIKYHESSHKSGSVDDILNRAPPDYPLAAGIQGYGNNASAVGPSPGQAYPSQGYPKQAYPTQGYPAQSYPTQSYPT